MASLSKGTAWEEGRRKLLHEWKRDGGQAEQKKHVRQGKVIKGKLSALPKPAELPESTLPLRDYRGPASDLSFAEP